MLFSTRSLFVLIAVIGVLGVLNAAYLSWLSLTGDVPTCFLNSGCDIVAASSYSRVFGIPLATLGVFFYSMIVGFSLWRALSPRAVVLPFLVPLSALGFLLSLYFLYLQAFAIGAYCEYCLFSLFDATVIFVLCLYLWRKTRREGVSSSGLDERLQGTVE